LPVGDFSRTSGFWTRHGREICRSNFTAKQGGRWCARRPKPSTELAGILAKRRGTAEQTVRKWRKRESVEDRCRMPHRLWTRRHRRGKPSQRRCARNCRSLLTIRSPVVRGFPIQTFHARGRTGACVGVAREICARLRRRRPSRSSAHSRHIGPAIRTSTWIPAATCPCDGRSSASSRPGRRPMRYVFCVIPNTPVRYASRRRSLRGNGKELTDRPSVCASLLRPRARAAHTMPSVSQRAQVEIANDAGGEHSVVGRDQRDRRIDREELLGNCRPALAMYPLTRARATISRLGSQQVTTPSVLRRQTLSGGMWACCSRVVTVGGTPRNMSSTTDSAAPERSGSVNEAIYRQAPGPATSLFRRLEIFGSDGR